MDFARVNHMLSVTRFAIGRISILWSLSMSNAKICAQKLTSVCLIAMGTISALSQNGKRHWSHVIIPVAMDIGEDIEISYM